ncbi:MAG: hypothetical protein QXW72_07975 [Conexivisphaerales archaeon]
MNAKVLGVLILLLAMAFPYSASYAQGSSQSQLGTLITSTMSGVRAAASVVPASSPAGVSLEHAMTYLKQAQELYRGGNYTGAQYYFSLAMNMSYEGVVSAGGKPFSVKPGESVSTEQAVKYAVRLSDESASISNLTLRSAIEANISMAEQLLANGNFTQARKLLGNTNARIQQYAKGELAVSFEANYVPKLLAKAHELNLSSQLNRTLYQEINDMQFQGVGQIIMYMRDYSRILAGNFSIPSGTIGVYRGSVYMVMPYTLQFVSIGGENFIVYVTMHKGMGSMHFRAQIIGEINSSYAASFVLSHNGTEITVFPPDSFSSPFSITLYDLGNMSYLPPGTVVQYKPGPIQPFNFTGEFQS